MNKSILKNSSHFFVLFFLSVVIVVIYSKDIDLMYASTGFGPYDYVNQKMYPENFTRDFLGLFMANHYDRSGVMQIFYYVHKFLGVSVSSQIPIFMFGQVLISIYATYLLSIEFGINRWISVLISFPILFFNYFAGIDMGRFSIGWGYFLELPLYYGWAHAFCMLSIYGLLRRSYWLMFLSLFAASFSHVAIGFFAGIFMSVAFLIEPQRLKEKGFFKAAIVFFVLLFWHLLVNVKLTGQTLSKGALGVEDWLKMTKLFCFHWYPFVMKMFTVRNTEFYSFVGSLLLGGLIWIRAKEIDKRLNLLLIGGLFSALLVIPGVIFSEIYPIPFLIKLNLQRASTFTTFFVVFVHSVVCLRDLKGKNIHALISFLVICIYFTNVSVVGKAKILTLMELMRLALLQVKMAKNFSFHFDLKKYFYVVLTIISIRYSVNYMDERVAIRDGGEVSRSFKLAQLWAKANTSTESLFAVDPAVSYAWRDFSARSSYGTFRDWGFVSLAYVADNAKYLEGKRRALIFGVNIDEINESAVYKGNGPNDYIYRKVIKKSYNSMDYAQVKKFLNDENIDYYVLNKVDHMYFEELKDYSVYRNEHYMIIGRDKINLNK